MASLKHVCEQQLLQVNPFLTVSNSYAPNDCLNYVSEVKIIFYRYPWDLSVLFRISIWRLFLTLMVTSVVGQKMSKERKNEKQTMSFCYQSEELDLTNAQRMDCRKHPAAFKYSLIGLKRAEEECKRLLIKNTWNCTGLISQSQKSLKRHDRTSIMSKSKS